MIEESKDTIKAFLSRFKNPFLGTFTASTIIINWDILISLVSSKMSPLERITLIENLVKPLDQSTSIFLGKHALARFLCEPFIATAILIVCVPFISHFFIWISWWHQIRKENIEMKAKYGVCIPKVDSWHLRQQLGQIRSEFLSMQSRYQNRDSDFKELNEKYDDMSVILDSRDRIYQSWQNFFLDERRFVKSNKGSELVVEIENKIKTLSDSGNANFLISGELFIQVIPSLLELRNNGYFIQLSGDERNFHVSISKETEIGKMLSPIKK